MNIEEILANKRFVLKTTTKWIAINDTHPAFEEAFRTKRFGKLLETRMYVTLERVKLACERLIVDAGLTPQYLPSTDGTGRIYPGFDTDGVSRGVLEELVDALLATADRHL